MTCLDALKELTKRHLALRRRVPEGPKREFFILPIPEPPAPVLVLDFEIAEETGLTVEEVRKNLLEEKTVRVVFCKWPGFKYELIVEIAEDRPLVKSIKEWLILNDRKKFVDREVYHGLLVKGDLRFTFEELCQALLEMSCSGFLKCDAEWIRTSEQGYTYSVREK